MIGSIMFIGIVVLIISKVVYDVQKVKGPKVDFDFAEDDFNSIF